MSDPIYELRIELLDIRPAIWRTVQVRPSITLQQLHKIIQAAMGWEDYHLFQFDHGKTRVLGDLLTTEGARIGYQYDFGDSWDHLITLKKITVEESGAAYPRCIAGKRACPPEDCGGFPGYEHICEILKDPKHKEHVDTLDWLGLDNANEFDAEAFDLNEANARLKTLQRKPKKKAA